jgi:hypothetical protein
VVWRTTESTSTLPPMVGELRGTRVAGQCGKPHLRSRHGARLVLTRVRPWTSLGDLMRLTATGCLALDQFADTCERDARGHERHDCEADGNRAGAPEGLVSS